MGGVGMLGGDDLTLPYPWIMRSCITIHGVWMYPREASRKMVGLIRAGLIDLTAFDTKTFPLDQVNEAIAHAAAHQGAFRATVLKL